MTQRPVVGVAQAEDPSHEVFDTCCFRHRQERANLDEAQIARKTYNDTARADVDMLAVGTLQLTAELRRAILF